MADQQLVPSSKLAYGIGHVFNDLCAAIWFSYLLVYLQHVVRMSSKMAGYVLLLGQVVDAISTPIIGYESDKTRACAKYGRRKTWHLGGSVCVALSFPFLFMEMHSSRLEVPLEDTTALNATSHTSQGVLFLHYAPFVILFQVGWAAVQVSHMALITDLSTCERVRIELGTIRYAWTIIANIIVYTITGILFGFAADSVEQGEIPATGDTISGRDAHIFKTLSLVVVGIGLVFTILFHIGTREKRDVHNLTGSENNPLVSSISVPMIWKDWFKETQFYQICCIYTCSRLLVNVTQLYMPLFLVYSLRMSKFYIAYMPLAVYCGGIVISLFLKCINTGLGRKATILVGLLLALVQVMVLHLTTEVLQRDSVSQKVSMFCAAILLGLGGTTVSVAALAMASDLIGKHSESGAFVYGCVSFGDKLANGLVVMIIQILYPCPTVICCHACQTYYYDVMQYSVLAIAAVTLGCLLTMGRKPIGKLKRYEAVTSVLS